MRIFLRTTIPSSRSWMMRSNFVIAAPCWGNRDGSWTSRQGASFNWRSAALSQLPERHKLLWLPPGRHLGGRHPTGQPSTCPASPGDSQTDCPRGSVLIVATRPSLTTSVAINCQPLLLSSIHPHPTMSSHKAIVSSFVQGAPPGEVSTQPPKAKQQEAIV